MKYAVEVRPRTQPRRLLPEFVIFSSSNGAASSGGTAG